MGFRTGAYAKVWDIKPRTPKATALRISTSRKPHGSDQYVQDFGGYVTCLGENAAKAALALKAGDKIKLGDVEVQTTYVKEKDTTYTNFNVFSFEKVSDVQPTPSPTDDPYNPATVVPDGLEDEGLPF